MRYAAPFMLLIAVGCVTAEGGPPLDLLGGNRLSTQDEIQLGSQMAVQVEQQTKTTTDQVLQDYVRNIGNRLAQFSPRKDVPYQFTVIDDPKNINAFALPGGHMYVFTGLMRLADNEAELAGVMAHEIAHVAAYHHGEQMTRQNNAAAITGLLLGKDPGAVAQIAASLVNQGYAMRFSRENEAEADQLGMDIMFRAGYQPVGMLTFMNKMVQLEAQEGGGPPIPIFASHPPTQERLARLQALLNQYPEQTRDKLSTNQQTYQQVVLSRLGR